MSSASGVDEYQRLRDGAGPLGIVIDSQLSLPAQVAAVWQGLLQQLRPLVRSMAAEAVKRWPKH